MIVISLIWVLLVFQIKTVLIGNSSWKLIDRTPQHTLEKSMEKMEGGDIGDEDSEENTFLYSFALSVLGSFLILLVELSVASYLLYENANVTSYNLAFGILYKNLLMFAIFATAKQKELSFFESINLIPVWALKIERISALASSILLASILWFKL
jgi:hypothetical protein